MRLRSQSAIAIAAVALDSWRVATPVRPRESAGCEHSVPRLLLLAPGAPRYKEPVTLPLTPSCRGRAATRKKLPMSQANVKTIGIVGAGIGGLAAGVALARDGHKVMLLERSQRLQEQGAGLVLWSNALRALSEIGMDRAVCEVGAPIDSTEVRTAPGDLLSVIPVAELSREARAETVIVRRATLARVLEQALPGGAVHWGAEVRGYSLRGERAVTTLADGTSHEFDVLVGADGLHSKVRSQLIGAAHAEGPVIDAWVGTSSYSVEANRLGVGSATIASGPRFWFAPLSRDTVFWWATRPQLGHARIEHQTELLGCYADWHDPIPAIIAHTRWDDVIKTRVAYYPPSEKWGEGPVTLLGDAVHPSTPDLGQGACQAIESAVALARSLRHTIDVNRALREYERSRQQRTGTIAKLSSITSVNSTIQSKALCRVRDALTRAGFAPIARSQLRWLMAGEVGRS